MSKMRILLVSVVTLVALSFNCLADNTNPEPDDIIDYVQKEEISSREEFLTFVGDEQRLEDVRDYVEVSFEISIDEANRYIVLDTVYELKDEPNRGTKSGKAEHDVYSDAGMLIYTITATGTFSYTTGSCTATSSGGTFSYPAVSLWRSTPSITTGHTSPSKAYVKVSGTATCVGFANRSYTLYLYCNSNGYLSSSFTGT